ncbi:MAG: V-type ATP synthase subunit I [Firmicutes bacterium]|nr:V-type ATP synthase subunit I [Bacillota bacterium]
MAIVKMKKLRLMVASSQREELLREIMLLGCVQVSQPPPEEENEQSLLSRADVPYLLQLKSDQNMLAGSLAVLKRYAPEKGGIGSLLSPLPEVATEVLLDERTKKEELETAEKILALDERIRKITIDRTARMVEIQGMEPWVSLDLPMEVSSTETSVIVRGTMPAAADPGQVQAALEAEAEMAELFTVSSDKSFHYMVLVSHKEQLEKAQAVLRPLGFTVMNAGEFRGTPAQIIEEGKKAIAAWDEEESECREQLASMGVHRQALKLRFDAMSAEIAQAEAESRLLCTESVSILEGWVPAADEPKLAALLEKYDCAYDTEDPAEDEYPQVPVLLKNSVLTRSLNAVTEMYSLPAYDGIDPNPYMTPFFIFFYGMMMADMGYGILMVLICLLVLKLKKPARGMRNFFELFLWCGFATIAWGAVTGGFFGDAPLQVAKILNPDTTFTGLPSLINPLEDTVMILVGSVALGFVHIITGTVIGFVDNIKRGEWKTAINDQVAWWVVFAGIGCLVLGLGPWVLALGGALVVLGSFLTNQGIGKVTGLFGALYNNVTGYFGDLLSYARLMALMLAGSVIAQVFNTLGAIPGNIIVFLIISIAGNALNLGLNLLGCFVHDLRLQCLEFFGKFYKDGGIPFRPLNIQTKYVSITNNKEEV